MKGVFDHLVSYAAFLDKLSISIWGVRRCRPLAAVRLGRNRSIGGGCSHYGRIQEGLICATGNPFELRYGRLSQEEFIPEHRLTLHSEFAATTECGVNAVIGALFCRPVRSSVSLLEFTFDTHFSMSFVQHHSLQRLRFHSLGHTAYVRTPRSIWQLRIYRKTPSVLRIEFVLRRAFLKAERIEEPEDIFRLRTIPISNKFPLREIRSHVRLFEASEPVWRVISDCRTQGWSAHGFLRACPEERLLRSMQRRFVW